MTNNKIYSATIGQFECSLISPSSLRFLIIVISKKTYSITAEINKNEIKIPIKTEYKYCFKKLLETSI